MTQICTCRKTTCALHPANHDQGCTPCIAKNLKTREMPSCFFNLLDNPEQYSGDTFEDFARQVLAGKADKA